MSRNKYSTQKKEKNKKKEELKASFCTLFNSTGEISYHFNWKNK